MGYQRLSAYLRNSLWFIPGLWVVGAALLAFGMIFLDRVTASIATHIPLLFGGGADGARSVLSSIASSSITVAGVTFSITIVALQLASSQFSPTVLRNFMRDRISQMVLGSFIGTFFYSILVLRSIRAERDDSAAFVPSIAVSVAILFAVVAVVMLVYFVHHISTRIQVSTIVGTISNGTAQRIRSDWPERDGDELVLTDGPADAPRSIPATKSGYLQLIDHQGLTGIGRELDILIRVDRRAGEWVQEWAPLFSIWPREVQSEALAKRLGSKVTLGSQRSLEQDAAFGIRQLVDVALKALSPGVNDPTTAVDCMNRLTELLVTTGTRREPQHRFEDDDGRLRLILRPRTFEELVGLAYDEIRHFGASMPRIVAAMASSIGTVLAAVPADRHEPLVAQARLILDRTDQITPEADRRSAVAHLNAVLSR